MASKQLDLFNMTPYVDIVPATPNGIEGVEFGTFKDSMRAPIHSWFRYPAGYSYKFVEGVFRQTGLTTGHWVYDPFSGTGTTLICAKQQAINGYGVEAHSFVHWVAQVKLYWTFDFDQLRQDLTQLLRQSRADVMAQVETLDLNGVFPELIYKCYHLQDLKELYLLREFVLKISDPATQDLLKLALTDTLRNAAAAGTGWPYIAPNKNTGDKPAKGATTLFERTVWKMYRDLLSIEVNEPASETHNVLGDSRQKQLLENDMIDLALTSPPYLNNYDYADRTRLETYFWGITKTWSDITRDFRSKLIVAATTQVVRSQYQVETVLSQNIYALSPQVYQSIQDAVLKLAQLRTTKGGKKDYDLMVALYFNDMLAVLQETYRILKPNQPFYLVLGDSAPYGVHIETENVIGQLGQAIGFRQFEYHEFRTRGGKWKQNPQRHTVPLREGVVILRK